MDKLEPVYKILPQKLRKVIEGYINSRSLQINEIRLRAGRPLMIRCGNDNKIAYAAGSAVIVTKEDVSECFMHLSRFSAYAFEEEIKNGFITIPKGHRVGISGKAVVVNSIVKSINYISFINIRIAGEKTGCADGYIEYICQNQKLLNTVIISPPGAGKTTLLRDIIRQVSNGNAYLPGKNVGVVDERSEICACYNGIPENDVGIRTDVIDSCPKTEGIRMLVRSMAPQVIAVDEIGTKSDIEAVKYASISGVAIVATFHGEDMNGILKTQLGGVFERFIVLQIKENKRLAHIYDREGRQIGCVT